MSNRSRTPIRRGAGSGKMLDDAPAAALRIFARIVHRRLDIAERGQRLCLPHLADMPLPAIDFRHLDERLGLRIVFHCYLQQIRLQAGIPARIRTRLTSFGGRRRWAGARCAMRPEIRIRPQPPRNGGTPDAWLWRSSRSSSWPM